MADATTNDMDILVKQIEGCLHNDKAIGLKAVDEVAVEFRTYMSFIKKLMFWHPVFKEVTRYAEGVPPELKELRKALSSKHIFEKYEMNETEFVNAGLQHLARFYSGYNYEQLRPFRGCDVDRMRMTLELILSSSIPDLESMIKFAADYKPQDAYANPDF